MAKKALPKEACAHFATLLAYPGPALPASATSCCRLLANYDPGAVARLQTFAGFVARTPLAQLEELYTATFDLQVVCYPYVGYQLYGESYKRGAFMVALKEHYRAAGFMPETEFGNELPDHLAVVLRFLSLAEDETVRRSLLAESVVPALRKMVQAFGDGGNPYGDLLRTLLAAADQPDAADEMVGQGLVPCREPLERAPFTGINRIDVVSSAEAGHEGQPHIRKANESPNRPAPNNGIPRARLPEEASHA